MAKCIPKVSIFSSDQETPVGLMVIIMTKFNA
jgi:hypothetical protein